MRDFRKLDIWNESILLVKLVYKLVDQLPDNEKYGLRSQMCRAAVSIPANIAEGSSRSSEADFKRFLEIAIGSAFELETHFIVTSEIGFFSMDKLQAIIEKVQSIQMKINALLNKLKQSINSH
jgi:four helix bundle protein